MSSLSPTQRTLRALRQQGCHCGIVERYIAQAGPYGKRIDLFGIIDVIALYPALGKICGVQSCGQSFAEHDRKLMESEMSIEWIKSGGALELWGWRKVKKKKGGKLMVWRPRIKRYCVINDELRGAADQTIKLFDWARGF